MDQVHHLNLYRYMHVNEVNVVVWVTSLIFLALKELKLRRKGHLYKVFPVVGVHHRIGM